eukprot:CAMPEP_0172307510 /NCGR_PEP_ID=MMETSP1058-20130122/8348_1 /TAXON_ID=83371 /ORGANISM="Detonula confervacea, Strain CCMP 353" /LENGTH=78 /DNA_ID=CAMNT_0013019691 /DNA_START=21 /DNA_END=257 /DNA_ORIENTATION=-
MLSFDPERRPSNKFPRAAHQEQKRISWVPSDWWDFGMDLDNNKFPCDENDDNLTYQLQDDTSSKNKADYNRRVSMDTP